MRKLQTEKHRRRASVTEQSRDAVPVVLGYLVTLIAACVTLYNGLLIVQWVSDPDRQPAKLGLYLGGIALVWLADWLFKHYYRPKRRRRL